MNLTLPTDSLERKNVPLASGVLAYFPAALAGVARVSKAGNDKHNPGEPLHHARGKSMDHADCVLRHLMDVQDWIARLDKHGDCTHTTELVTLDDGTAGEAAVSLSESILIEASQLCWRALALSQELHERFGAPLAPGARLPSKVEAWAKENPELAKEVTQRLADFVAKKDEAAYERPEWQVRPQTVTPPCAPARPERTVDIRITPGVYRSREGMPYVVSYVDSEGMFPAKGFPQGDETAGNTLSWTLAGKHLNASTSSYLDLIERLPDTSEDAVTVPRAWSDASAVIQAATDYNRKFEERMARDKAKRDAPEPLNHTAMVDGRVGL